MQNSKLPVFDRLERHLLGGASFVVSQDIDYQRNSFTLTVQSLPNSENITISKADIVRLGLLPSGSRWRQGLGWHSYFGVPFELKDRQWVAIGAEAIVKHIRGDTHPVFRAYIFQMSPPQNQGLINGLQKLATEIGPNVKPIQQVRTGIVASDSLTPDEHTRVEAWVIQSAIKAYGTRVLQPALLFRTLILAEDQLRKQGYPAPNLWGNRSGYLMATSPVIQKTFSLRMRIALFLCRAYFVSTRT